MRNHDQKPRDMARSILPSTSRSGARKAKRAVHATERRRERELLDALYRADDPDDVELDLGHHGRDRSEIAFVVSERRFWDTSAPLVRWAEAVVERDPVLSMAGPAERRAHFRGVVGSGLIADHALFHLEWSVLATDVRRSRPAPPRPVSAPYLRQVQEVYEAGLHAELNRRLKAARRAAARPRTRAERRRAEQEGRNPWDAPPATGRLLAGPHDIRAFAGHTARLALVTGVVAGLHEHTR